MNSNHGIPVIRTGGEWEANRVLARISKMPGQNRNSKISARPDLAINLLQILLTKTCNSLLCQKRQFILQPCPRRWFLGKYLVITPKKFKIENSL